MASDEGNRLIYCMNKQYLERSPFVAILLAIPRQLVSRAAFFFVSMEIPAADVQAGE